MGKNPDKIVGVYSMTKSALINMVKWLAQELIDDDIRVNAIAPGFVYTRMTDSKLLSDFSKSFKKPEKVAA